ncbi:hypothetical protein [Ilumatobacter nonamiensis]|uniref:hypothetical protein n=1 Tax=Ilumatobacter nonamiensis TaxID=467093 RepID=UPI00058ECF3A|nr:hypothetical protein [Ilumatobacter nonamiensis]
MTNVPADAELERLRGLVGPSEMSYEALQADVIEAERVARAAVTEMGELRGRIVELEGHLARARQDQDFLQRRIEMSAWEGVMYRAQRRWRISVVPRMKRLSD